MRTGDNWRNPEDNINLVNPLSKVKKHLIDNIDFREIHQAMHKKSDKLSLYESFCQKLK